MKQLLHLFLFVTIVSATGYTQEPFNRQSHLKIFETIDFNSGDYVLLGIRGEGSRHRLKDTLSDFYIQDTVILNKLKKKWDFHKPGRGFACGYDYNLILVKKKVNQMEFSVNLECEELSCDLGYYHFDPNLMRLLIGQTKRVYTKFNSFQTIEEARSVLPELKARMGFIYAPEENWENYEGSFEIVFSFNKSKYSKYENDELLKRRLMELIEAKFPNELGRFRISMFSSSMTSSGWRITCNESLYKIFNLEIDRIPFVKSNWEPFEQNTLKSYWTTIAYDKLQDDVPKMKKSSLLMMDWDVFSWILLGAVCATILFNFYTNQK